MRSDSVRSQAASSCSVPITLISCSARAGLPGSGYQRIPQWTTVSTSVAGSSRESTALRMSASMKSVRDELGRRRAAVDPGDVGDRRVALEPAGELGAPVDSRPR